MLGSFRVGNMSPEAKVNYIYFVYKQTKVNYTYPKREGSVNCTEVKNERTTTETTVTTVALFISSNFVSVVAKNKFKIEVAMAFN